MIFFFKYANVMLGVFEISDFGIIKNHISDFLMIE